jgi:integrase
MNELAPTHLARRLTAPEFQGLSEVPPELEWFANLDNPRTRRAYERDVRDFMGFIGIHVPAEFRTVSRAHLIAWRKDLERRALAWATIRRKLSALSSLFQYLCEKNAVAHNPVDGVKRPTAPRLGGRDAGAERRPGAHPNAAARSCRPRASADHGSR